MRLAHGRSVSQQTETGVLYSRMGVQHRDARHRAVDDIRPEGADGAAPSRRDLLQFAHAPANVALAFRLRAAGTQVHSQGLLSSQSELIQKRPEPRELKESEESRSA